MQEDRLEHSGRKLGWGPAAASGGQAGTQRPQVWQGPSCSLRWTGWNTAAASMEGAWLQPLKVQIDDQVQIQAARWGEGETRNGAQNRGKI